MNMNVKELEVVIKSLVLTSKNGLSLKILNKQFEEEIGYRIPFNKYGYDSLESFLSSLCKSVTIYRNGGDIIVKAVSSSKTKHIEQMVAAQNKKRTKRRVQNRSSVKKSETFGSYAKKIAISDFSQYANVKSSSPVFSKSQSFNQFLIDKENSSRQQNNYWNVSNNRKCDRCTNLDYDNSYRVQYINKSRTENVFENKHMQGNNIVDNMEFYGIQTFSDYIDLFHRIQNYEKQKTLREIYSNLNREYKSDNFNYNIKSNNYQLEAQFSKSQRKYKTRRSGKSKYRKHFYI